VNQGHHQWFTHTAAAARQFVEIVQGRKEVPEDLRAAAFETTIGYEAEMQGGLEGFDLAVVEVSTVKEHRVGDIELNAHKVYHAALELGIEYQPFVNGDVSQVPDGHPLKALSVTRASGDLIESQISEVQSLLGVPVLAVDHLYYEVDGSPLPERSKLTEVLEAVSRRPGIGFHSTRDLIVEHGAEVALEDSNHYRKEFEAVAAAGLYGSVRRMLKSA
jgi:hypothetical protein